MSKLVSDGLSVNPPEGDITGLVKVTLRTLRAT